MNLTAYQLDALAQVRNNPDRAIAVKSTAGSGKTTLIEFITRITGTGTQSLAFNKDAGDQLSAKVTGRAGTMHAAGLRMLRTFGELTIDDSIVYTIAAQALGVPKYPKTAEDRALAAKCFLVSDLANSLRNELAVGADDSRIAEVINKYEINIKAEDYSLIVSLAHNAIDAMRHNPRVLDFTGMLYLPVVLGLSEICDVLVIDEAQDINPLRLAFVERCFQYRQVIFVGDDNQSIYQWNGAIPDCVAFLSDKWGAIVCKLPETFRNSNAVTLLVNDLFPDIEHVTRNAAEGDFGYMRETDLLTSVQYGDAILARTNAELVAIWHKLIRAGKRAKMAGSDDIQNALVKALANLESDSLTGAIAELESAIAERQAKKWRTDIQDTLLYLCNQSERIADVKNLIYDMFSPIDCPKCKNGMVLRQGSKTLKSGKKWAYKFWGCSRYPKCKGSYNLSDITPDDQPYVHLSTIHKAKGLQWETVYVLNAPIETEQIAALKGTEEYNVWFVAYTRAILNVYAVSTE